MPAEALPADGRHWSRVVLLLLFVALVCARMPDIVLQGRFWAEEGRYFFHDAAVMPWWRALLMPIGGYLNIVANGAGILARHLVPLRDAPFVTIAIALVCQGCPILVLLSAGDRWLQRLPILLAATLLLATPVAADEVWLNSIHGQFHLALANALILALEPVAGAAGLFRLVLLLLGPLAGPASVFLLPLFALRFLIDRDRPRLLQLAAITLGSAIQLLCFYVPTSGRSYGIGPAVFGAVLFEKHLALPLLGRQAAGPIGKHLHDVFERGLLPHVALASVTAAVVLFLWAVLRSRLPVVRWLVLGAVLIETLSDYGAIDGRTKLLWATYGERYAFVPSALLSLSVLALAADRRGPRVTAAIAGLLVLWSIGIGLRDALARPDPAFAHGPDWAEAIRAWRTDPSRPIAIWPSGWGMVLPPPGNGNGGHEP